MATSDSKVLRPGFIKHIPHKEWTRRRTGELFPKELFTGDEYECLPENIAFKVLCINFSNVVVRERLCDRDLLFTLRNHHLLTNTDTETILAIHETKIKVNKLMEILTYKCKGRKVLEAFYCALHDALEKKYSSCMTNGSFRHIFQEYRHYVWRECKTQDEINEYESSIQDVSALCDKLKRFQAVPVTQQLCELADRLKLKHPAGQSIDANWICEKVMEKYHADRREGFNVLAAALLKTRGLGVVACHTLPITYSNPPLVWNCFLERLKQSQWKPVLEYLGFGTIERSGLSGVDIVQALQIPDIEDLPECFEVVCYRSIGHYPALTNEAMLPCMPRTINAPHGSSPAVVYNLFQNNYHLGTSQCDHATPCTPREQYIRHKDENDFASNHASSYERVGHLESPTHDQNSHQASEHSNAEPDTQLCSRQLQHNTPTLTRQNSEQDFDSESLTSMSQTTKNLITERDKMLIKKIQEKEPVNLVKNIRFPISDFESLEQQRQQEYTSATTHASIRKLSGQKDDLRTTQRQEQRYEDLRRENASLQRRVTALENQVQRRPTSPIAEVTSKQPGPVPHSTVRAGRQPNKNDPGTAQQPRGAGEQPLQFVKTHRKTGSVSPTSQRNVYSMSEGIDDEMVTVWCQFHFKSPLTDQGYSISNPAVSLTAGLDLESVFRAQQWINSQLQKTFRGVGYPDGRYRSGPEPGVLAKINPEAEVTFTAECYDHHCNYYEMPRLVGQESVYYQDILHCRPHKTVYMEFLIGTRSYNNFEPNEICQKPHTFKVTGNGLYHNSGRCIVLSIPF